MGLNVAQFSRAFGEHPAMMLSVLVHGLWTKTYNSVWTDFIKNHTEGPIIASVEAAYPEIMVH